MITRPITGYRLVDGKLVKRKPRQPAGQRKNQEAKARRLVKAWTAKSRSRS